MPKKSCQKFKNLKNRKSFNNEIKNIIILGLSFNQIKPTFFEGESQTLSNRKHRILING